MTDTYCEQCARWTDPSILVDGSCPGCRVATAEPAVTRAHLLRLGFVAPTDPPLGATDGAAFSGAS